MHIIWQMNQGRHFYNYQKAKSENNRKMAKKEIFLATVNIFLIHGFWDALISLVGYFADTSKLANADLIGGILLVTTILFGIIYGVRSIYYIFNDSDRVADKFYELPIVGEVLECTNHPDSDHLHVCKVDVGSEVLQIVCGAPNVRVGLKVIVAKVGAVLPEITIKKGVIRGVESNGMLCSLRELGIDHKFLSQKDIDLSKASEIGIEAFRNCKSIDVSILNGRICKQAFYKTNIKNINYVADECVLESMAFSSCDSLEKFNIKGVFVQDLGCGVFKYCKNLEEVGPFIAPWIINNDNEVINNENSFDVDDDILSTDDEEENEKLTDYTFNTAYGSVTIKAEKALACKGWSGASNTIIYILDNNLYKYVYGGESELYAYNVDDIYYESYQSEELSVVTNSDTVIVEQPVYLYYKK